MSCSCAIASVGATGYLSVTGPVSSGTAQGAAAQHTAPRAIQAQGGIVESMSKIRSTPSSTDVAIAIPTTSQPNTMTTTT